MKLELTADWVLSELEAGIGTAFIKEWTGDTVYDCEIANHAFVMFVLNSLGIDYNCDTLGPDFKDFTFQFSYSDIIKNIKHLPKTAELIQERCTDKNGVDINDCGVGYTRQYKNAVRSLKLNKITSK